MSVSDQEIELILKSFELAQSEKPFSAAAALYENLFAREPSFRAMFRDDLGGQGMKFMSTLKTIVVALRDPEALAAELETLGQSHAAVGVVAVNFEPMGEALIDTFKGILGTDFTAEMETAWRAAYDEIAKEMIRRGGIVKS